MAITKEKKEAIVAKVMDILSHAGSVAFVHFNKYTIREEHAMRRKLKAEGVGYYVAKKTLLARALDSIAPKGDRPALQGEIALAYGSDAIAPAREVAEFAKKSDGRLAIVGGIFEGAYQDALAMNALAAIPPMQTLRGMFANVINSPMQRFVIVLDQIAAKKV